MDTYHEVNDTKQPSENSMSINNQYNEQTAHVFIVDSLNTLAQCAVGVFSVIGTIIIAVVGFGIDKKNIFLIIFAFLISFSADAFHLIFRIWSLPYVINLMLIDDNLSDCLGLKLLICHLFDIEDWEAASAKIKKIVCPPIGKKQIDSKRRKIYQDAGINLSLWPNHFGVLAILLCTNLVLFIICCIGLFSWRG